VEAALGSPVRRITFRTADLARALTLAALFLLLWHFFWRVYPALFLVLLAVLIAIVLHVPARWLSRWIPFRVAYALVVVLLVGSVAGLLVALVPQVVDQGALLATELPRTIDSAVEWYRQKTGRRDPALERSVGTQAAQFVARFVPWAFNAITVALGSFALLVLAVFLGAQPELYHDLLMRLAPPESRPRWERIYQEAGGALRAWVIAKSLTMLGIGVATWIGLSLFGIPGALALAAFAGLMEFIPNVGPTIAAVPAVIAAFALSPATSLWVAVFYFALQQVQNALTVPLVEKRAVKIPPAVLLTWQLMLATGFGLLALFVATPLLAVLAVVLRVAYLEPHEERAQWDRREPPAGNGAAPERSEGEGTGDS
jgi:predicted PurR-regulated permease PerM